MTLPQRIRVLHEASGFVVKDFRCACGAGHPSPEEASSTTDFAFVRRGYFRRVTEGQARWMDPNRVLFSNTGEVSRIIHPVDGGDDCTIFQVPEGMLREVVARHRPGDAERPYRVLGAPDVPASARTYLLHRLLLADLEAGNVEPLRLQTRVLDLLDAALTTAHGRPERRAPVGAAARRHRELAAGAAEILARNLADPPDLAGLSLALDSSPFHLHRVFRAAAGLPLHRYLMGLRLRAALERLSDHAEDLTAVALDLGFSDHSHFTNAFRREFGLSPSVARRASSRKILQARSSAGV